MTRNQTILAALMVVCVLHPGNAYAYLDPVSGSIILQLVLGGVAGAAVVLKLFWRRIRALFGAGSSSDPGDGNSSV